MSENTPQNSQESVPEKPGNPDSWNDAAWKQLLREVQYHYSNRLAMSVSGSDVRMAFADELPGGQTVPKVGIIMSHQHARAVLELLQRNVKSIDDQAAKRAGAKQAIPSEPEQP